ncbi:glycosyltransferase family 39 protein [Chlorogloeopsis sp. ULAP01]|uniref:glycosyltransferase family 39 protein n=1 Tax=Chlorogloeopsis sp. ULAP01 TaxID=3056483 RepID=UPI0025AADFDB|nr:glycosyltransferase family 39 protein [Chlorogloeopsis sp. ULAP01]MDM9382040.1 glycosyltransferase family 39 protein [Chlorogloeopsis sp. ULAP01]
MRRLVLAPRWLQILVIVVLVVGIFFRFVNLNGKVYSHNEIYTSLRIAGYTNAQVKQQLFNGRVISKETFAKFLYLNPQKGFNDTIKALAEDAPQYPPMYYLIARFWAQIFGNSVTAIRSLSALISLLVFPSIYWLCRELFKVPLSLPGIAIALIAISPIHLIYAQEGQVYIFWIVSILLSSAALLRALRLESPRQTEESRIYNWGIYTVTLAFSLYTFLLSGFVAVAHGIYVIAATKFFRHQTARAYLLSSGIAFLLFMPWLIVILGNFFQFQSSSQINNSLSPINLIVSWLIQVSRVFFDLNLNWDNPFTYLFILIFLVIAGYAIYFIWRTTHDKTSLFIISLIAIPILPLLLPALIFGGISSIEQSYLIPSLLGIQISTAYLFSVQLYNGCVSRRQIWQILLVLVISAGVISFAISSQAETWWSKFVSYGNPQVAKIINQYSPSLLISDDFENNYGNLFSLSYLVEPQVRFQLVKDKNIPKIPQGFSNIFLFNPSPGLRKGIEKKYKLKTQIVYKDKYSSLLRLARLRI